MKNSPSRRKFASFFADTLDDALRAKLGGAEASPNLKEGMVEYQRRLNAEGWMAPGWPVDYGGQDWSMIQHFIFNAERGKAGALAAGIADGRAPMDKLMAQAKALAS